MTAAPAGELAPLDPFRPAPGGRWADAGIVVARRRPLHLVGRERWVGRTTHFGIAREAGRLLVVHGLGAVSICADVAADVAQELFAPGWVVGADAFERLVVGIVLTAHEDPATAWEAFYRNTLARIEDGVDRCGFAPVYRRAEALVADAGARSVLDLGSCFGFGPLRLADGAAGPVEEVVTCDVVPGTVRLLDLMGRRLGTPVRTLACDAACVPVPDASSDVVTVVHLLEHVDAAHGARILAEACRIARRRVVVAVPVEDAPDATFGHVRTFTQADLLAAAAELTGAGWHAETSDDHGAWLVLDRSCSR